MPSLSETFARLSELRGATGAQVGGVLSGGGRLAELDAFGSNPGALRGRYYVPEGLSEPAALVVVLHGCTQTADGYDTGAGWSQLADRHGFALLYPEQQRANNPNVCFNWFTPEDIRRDGGEAGSIRQMIDTMMDRHEIDPARVFVTGLSAGGAMAAVMLATYPELFAGGAIIAGLPYGCAAGVPQAMDRMRGNGMPDVAKLAALVRGASSYAGPWPTVSVWHGSADTTVSPMVGEAIVGQWAALHGVATAPTRTETVDGYPRRVWCEAGGRVVIEAYGITGMAHGTPLATTGEHACGKRGAHMLEAGISSTYHIASFWGLTADRAAAGSERRVAERVPELTHATIDARPAPAAANAATGVGKVIEDALRAAGLMR